MKKYNIDNMEIKVVDDKQPINVGDFIDMDLLKKWKPRSFTLINEDVEKMVDTAWWISRILSKDNDFPVDDQQIDFFLSTLKEYIKITYDPSKHHLLK